MEQKLAALGKHSTDKVSSRVDKLTDGRLIKVTRDPLPRGGGSPPMRTSPSKPSATRSIWPSLHSATGSRACCKTVSDCTTALKSTATDLFGSSEQTSLRANGIVEASQGASISVGNAAEATRQMSDSATQIGQQIDQTTASFAMR